MTASDERIREMIQKGHTFCDHAEGKSVVSSTLGYWHYMMCTLCARNLTMYSAFSHYSPLLCESDRKYFVDIAKQNIKRYKEIKKEMTSEYRRGVEDATEPFKPNEIGTSNYHTLLANERLVNRRKSLLKTKVTKWVNVFQSNVGDILTSGMALFSSKTDAEQSGKRFTSYLGTSPVEIEVPVD